MADNLADIIARLETATGHDWKLNAEICEYFEVQSTVFHEAQAVTKSIDAAVALAARLLPECRIKLDTKPHGGGGPFVEVQTSQSCSFGTAATPALALCLAIVRAVAAKGTPHGR